MAFRIPEEHAPKSGAKPRALLDTNIWRYIVDAEAEGRLLGAARRGAYDIQIAPSVLYEKLRIQDVALRSRHVRLMVNARFKRLMPEAYSESMEILREIERARPEWLRPNPNLQFFKRLKNDWHRTRGGFWVRCARTPSREASFVAQLEGNLIPTARAQSYAARKEMRESEWKKNPPMDKTLVSFPQPEPGWRGDPVEAWRADSLLALAHALAQPGNPYRDWVAPFLDLDSGLLASPRWVEFWLYEAEKSALPRQWLRWAHSFAQRFRKVSPGSPADTQLFTYLLETDLVLTSDKAFVDILEECRPYAPCLLPQAIVVPAGPEGVAKLLKFLNTETG